MIRERENEMRTAMEKEERVKQEYTIFSQSLPAFPILLVPMTTHAIHSCISLSTRPGKHYLVHSRSQPPFLIRSAARATNPTRRLQCLSARPPGMFVLKLPLVVLPARLSRSDPKCLAATLLLCLSSLSLSLCRCLSCSRFNYSVKGTRKNNDAKCH